MNYRGFGLAWLVLWLAMPACAATVTLGELSLDTGNAWQRADAQEEADYDSIVLRERSEQPELEVYLARQRVRLKAGEAKFIEQLEQSWRRRYGTEVQLDWLESAGTRWRVCRRPSRSGDGNVFQIVTVHNGEVYQVVATAPAMVRALPRSVRTFLASAVWAGVKLPDRRETAGSQDVSSLTNPLAVPETAVDTAVTRLAPQPDVVASAPVVVAPVPTVVTPAPVSAAAAPEPAAVGPAPVAVTPAPVAITPIPEAVTAKPAAMTAAPVAVASVPASAEAAPPAKTVKPAGQVAEPGKQWRLLRTVIALPEGKAWPELAEAEGSLLGQDGLVKGLGLSAKADGIDGFLEGFLWQKESGSAEHRQPYRRHWRVFWPSFPQRWQGSEGLAFDLDFLADTTGLGQGGDLTLLLDLTPVCAPRAKVVHWLDGLETEGPGGMGQLAEMTCPGVAGTPAPALVTVAAGEYPAGAEAGVRKHVVLPLPAGWAEIRPKTGQEVARLVLTVRFRISEAGRAPGDAMFRQAAVVFVFGPEV